MTFAIAIGLMTSNLRVAIAAFGMDVNVNVPSVILLVIVLFFAHVLKLGLETMKRNRKRR